MEQAHEEESHGIDRQHEAIKQKFDQLQAEGVAERGGIYYRPELLADEFAEHPDRAYAYSWIDDDAELGLAEQMSIGEKLRITTTFQVPAEVLGRPANEGQIDQTITSNVLYLNFADQLIADVNESAKAEVAISQQSGKPIKSWAKPEAVAAAIKEIEKNRNEPPIICIPGVAGSATISEGASLANRGRKVFMCSQPENGSSDTSRADIDHWTTIEPYVCYFQALTRQLLGNTGLDRFHAVGWSTGSMIWGACAAAKGAGETNNVPKISKLVALNAAGYQHGRIFPGMRASLGVVRDRATLAALAVRDMYYSLRKKDHKAPIKPRWITPPDFDSEKEAPNVSGELDAHGAELPPVRNPSNRVDLLRVAGIVGRGLDEEMLLALPEDVRVCIMQSQHDVYSMRRIQRRLRHVARQHPEFAGFVESRFSWRLLYHRTHDSLGMDELVGEAIQRWLAMTAEDYLEERTRAIKRARQRMPMRYRVDRMRVA